MGTGSLLHKVNIMKILSANFGANALIAGLISFVPVLVVLVGPRRCLPTVGIPFSDQHNGDSNRNDCVAESIAHCKV